MSVRVGPRRTAIALTLVLVGAALAAGVEPAGAAVTAVKGSAYGYTFSVSLFGGAPRGSSPVPTVTLAADASNSPQSASAPSARAAIDPATFFTSGPITVRTEGSLGANGSVTSSTSFQGVNTSKQEAFTASSLSTTCTAPASGAPTGSVSVTDGTLLTDNGDDDPANTVPDHPPVTVPVPANPGPNTVIEGHVHLANVVDHFQYVFNEQVVNPDGSISVNAFHEKLLGPTAVGDLVVGHVECGVTSGSPSTTSTSAPGSSTTTSPATTTTTAASTTTTTGGTTTTTAASPSTTAAGNVDPTASAQTVSDVGGGAYGYYLSISLFGGPPIVRGPAPTVTLPPGGSSTPITASDPSGSATAGPATLFTSDRLDVSTQGTTGPTGTVSSSVTIANTNKSGNEQLTAAAVGSTCTASPSGVSGSTTVTGGKLITSGGNVDGDEVSVDVPANPAPNTSFDGKVESVGDSFRVVLNEQQTSAGSITVNAMHMYLLGPTAIGDLIIGQSRCSLTASGSGGGGGSGSGSGGTGSGPGGMPRTGTDARFLAVLALALVGAGWNAISFTRWRRAGARRAAAAVGVSVSPE